MDATVEIEQAMEAGQNQAQVVERFGVWRASRLAGGRIPPELFAVAVDMAKVHGLYRISKERRLDYSGLKRRLEGVGDDVQGGRADTDLSSWLPRRPAARRPCATA